MKRILLASVIGFLLILVLGTAFASAYDNSNPKSDCAPCHGPIKGPSYTASQAPAKGHQWWQGKGIGHETAPGQGHDIHNLTSGI